MPKKQFKQLQARVPPFVFEKAEQLLREVGPMGEPRAMQSDLVGALLYVATAKQAAKALDAYNPKLGQAMAELEQESDMPT